mgnify:CR=1 FL=1
MTDPKDVRIYRIDKPATMSCGEVFVTDLRNKIILCDDYYGTEPTMKLVFQAPRDMPHTLAPYPTRDHDWAAGIKTGVRVFASCDVDIPSGGFNPEEDEIPKIQGLELISREHLDKMVHDYRAVALAYKKEIAAALKSVDDKYRAEKQAILRKIKQGKARARNRHIAPDLVSMILE